MATCVQSPLPTQVDVPRLSTPSPTPTQDDDRPMPVLKPEIQPTNQSSATLPVASPDWLSPLVMDLGDDDTVDMESVTNDVTDEHRHQVTVETSDSPSVGRPTFVKFKRRILQRFQQDEQQTHTQTITPSSQNRRQQSALNTLELS